MKLNLTKEWFEREVADGSDLPVTAGSPDVEAFYAAVDEHRQAQARRESTALPFAKLINLQRRASSLTLEELAVRAEIDLLDLYKIEHGEECPPEPRTVFQLADALGLPYQKLFQLSGLTIQSNSRMKQEAIRFAARSEPVNKLTEEEHEALREFVTFLSED